MWQTSAGQWPARPAESRRRDWNELDGAGTVEMFEKITVHFEKNTAIFEKKVVLLQILSVLPDKVTRFLFEFHAHQFESLDLPFIPTDRSDFDVH